MRPPFLQNVSRAINLDAHPFRGVPRTILLKLSTGMSQSTSQKLTGFFGLLTVLSCLLYGCGRLTIADLAGSYVRTGGGIKDVLTLYTNGSFAQLVSYTNGSNWSISGTWTIGGEVVELSMFYSAFDFEHKSIKVPPEYLAIQPLFIEKLLDRKIKLKVNDYEPIWVRQQSQTNGASLEPYTSTAKN